MHFESEGLRKTSFSTGVINLALTAFVIGRYPEYYWCMYLVKAAVMVFYKLIFVWYPAKQVRDDRILHTAYFILHITVAHSPLLLDAALLLPRFLLDNKRNILGSICAAAVQADVALRDAKPLPLVFRSLEWSLGLVGRSPPEQAGVS